MSSSFQVSDFIKEVANRFSYDPYSFNLKWKCQGDLVIKKKFFKFRTNLNSSKNVSFKIELSQYYEMNRTLGDIGLNEHNRRNIFEIHEKDGPPIRINLVN